MTKWLGYKYDVSVVKSVGGEGRFSRAEWKWGVCRFKRRRSDVFSAPRAAHHITSRFYSLLFPANPASCTGIVQSADSSWLSNPSSRQSRLLANVSSGFALLPTNHRTRRRDLPEYRCVWGGNNAAHQHRGQGRAAGFRAPDTGAAPRGLGFLNNTDRFDRKRVLM